MSEAGPTTATLPPAPKRGEPGSGGVSGNGRWLRLARTGFQTRNLIVLAVVIVIAYLAAVPLFYLIHGTFVENGSVTLDAFGRAYSAVGLGEMVWNSFLFAGGSALLAMVIGTFLAYVTIRTDAPFPTLVFAASMVPLIIPGVLYTIAWILLSSENIGVLNQVSSAILGRPVFDAFSMPGMIWVEGTHNAPLVYLFMVAAFRSMDPAMEESALLSGANRLTMIRRIALPLVRPALAAATLIMVVRGLEGFEVPALLGVPGGIFVFTSRIFYELQNFPIDTAAAGSLSLSLLAFAAVGVFLTNRFGSGRDGQFSTITGKGFRPHPIELRRAKPVVGTLVLLYFLVTAALPVGVLLYTSMLPFAQQFSLDVFSSMTFDNYAELFDDRAFPRATMNSLLLGAGAATAVVVLAAIAAWLIARTKVPGRQIVDQLAFLPLVVPGIVLGLAVSFVYLRNPLPFQVYGTMLILLIAYVTRFLPYGMRYAVSAIQQISGELEESAYVSGASWWKTFRRVLVPLIVPGLLAGWLYTFIISVRELSSSIVLYTPGNEVLSILTWNYYEDGQLTTVAALGVVMIGGLTVLVTLVYAIGTRFGLRDR
ncbi:ABC transporter permease [Jiangella asiatica]|uniref:ABC transporter permease n=1 Tax=Jiangella asiatica TaxID=2530372 RepID=UPI00193E416C|nr:iron ABC transporter permease [Jiangella asiatica]